MCRFSGSWEGRETVLSDNGVITLTADRDPKKLRRFGSEATMRVYLRRAPECQLVSVTFTVRKAARHYPIDLQAFSYWRVSCCR